MAWNIFTKLTNQLLSSGRLGAELRWENLFEFKVTAQLLERIKLLYIIGPCSTQLKNKNLAIFLGWFKQSLSFQLYHEKIYTKVYNASVTKSNTFSSIWPHADDLWNNIKKKVNSKISCWGTSWFLEKRTLHLWHFSLQTFNDPICL